MRFFIKIAVPMLLHALLAHSYQVTEPKSENCTDPNAELRLDNVNCTLTCNKRSLIENPDFCFKAPKLSQACYCKQGLMLDEAIGKCVQPYECSCNEANNELSKFSNECANNCATFHTLERCPQLLRSQCWCHDFYCKVNGSCILKESYFGDGFRSF